MADITNKWYVMRAVSGKEAKLKEYIEAEMKHSPLLTNHVSQVLIPMEKHAVQRGGKSWKRRRLLFQDTFLLNVI